MRDSFILKFLSIMVLILIVLGVIHNRGYHESRLSAFENYRPDNMQVCQAYWRWQEQYRSSYSDGREIVANMERICATQ